MFVHGPDFWNVEIVQCFFGMCAKRNPPTPRVEDTEDVDSLADFELISGTGESPIIEDIEEELPEKISDLN